MSEATRNEIALVSPDRDDYVTMLARDGTQLVETKGKKKLCTPVTTTTKDTTGNDRDCRGVGDRALAVWKRRGGRRHQHRLRGDEEADVGQIGVKDGRCEKKMTKGFWSSESNRGQPEASRIKRRNW